MIRVVYSQFVCVCVQCVQSVVCRQGEATLYFIHLIFQSLFTFLLILQQLLLECCVQRFTNVNFVYAPHKMTHTTYRNIFSVSPCFHGQSTKQSEHEIPSATLQKHLYIAQRYRHTHTHTKHKQMQFYSGSLTFLYQVFNFASQPSSTPSSMVFLVFSAKNTKIMLLRCRCQCGVVLSGLFNEMMLIDGRT